MKQMKAKTFVILMICAFVAALCVLAGAIRMAQSVWGREHNWRNGYIDVLSHFTNREEKANYILQADLPHTAFILGGSKSAALEPDLLNSYTNEQFYNFFVGNGNFRDYELYTNFLLSKYKGTVKEIILHLSSHESETFIHKESDFIPAAIAMSIPEKLQSEFRFLKKYYLNLQTFFDLYKSRLYEKDSGITNEYGARTRFGDDRTQKLLETAPVKYQNDVFAYWGKYENCIRSLFYGEVYLAGCDKNIEALRHIKAMCDSRGVKFTVVIGPTFIAEIYKYKTLRYAEYLKEIVDVCGEVWNFSGINAIDMNPHNFANGGHYFIFVGDKMIETMYSTEPNTSDMDSFGILLTSDNIGAYIESQREKWRALKAEYDKTGAITLQGKTDASYLGK